VSRRPNSVPFNEFTKVLGRHLDRSCQSWKLRLKRCFERRRMEIDKRFDIFLEDRDYDSIKIYLDLEKNKQGLSEHCRKCLRGLSIHLMQLVESVQLGLHLPSSSCPSQFKHNDAIVKIHVLEKAEQVLCSSIEILPPAYEGSDPWKLRGAGTRLKEEIERALVESTVPLEGCIRDDDLVGAVICLEHCQSLAQLVGNKETVATARDEVEELFVRFEDFIAEFLASISISTESNGNQSGQGEEPRFSDSDAFLRIKAFRG
jgi:hypothetical protein